MRHCLAVPVRKDIVTASVKLAFALENHLSTLPSFMLANNNSRPRITQIYWQFNADSRTFEGAEVGPNRAEVLLLLCIREHGVLNVPWDEINESLFWSKWERLNLSFCTPKWL